MKKGVVNGPEIRRRRAELQMSRPEFCRRAGISLSYLKLIEAQPPEDCPWPSDRMMATIADGLGCTVEDISQPRSSDRLAA